MHLHILGICGTFMGGLALLARELGYRVTGSDANVYPPMSTQLQAAGIDLHEGYDDEYLALQPDVVVVGNAMARGNPAVEALLNSHVRYVSGPQWLREQVLDGRWVLACAGTHGKTSTSSMLAWILEFAGYQPGFLIGGVPQDFGQSARLGNSDFFVIEADEYDSAFFDKRSKLVHYRARTAVLNNLEFDHADIFDDLAAIQRQMHHFVRTIPSQGQLIVPAGVSAIDETLAMGCWTDVQSIGDGGQWAAQKTAEDGSAFVVLQQGQEVAHLNWSLSGDHNVANAMSAIVAARHVGVDPALAAEALGQFAGVKRRMQVLGTPDGVTVYDDFAHHPTAIETTLQGLRRKVGAETTIWAVIEPRSNTMRMGQHRHRLAESCNEADRVLWFQPEGVDWSLTSVAEACRGSAQVCGRHADLVAILAEQASAGDHVVIMSNGGFGGVHHSIVDALTARA